MHDTLNEHDIIEHTKDNYVSAKNGYTAIFAQFGA